MNNLSLQKKSPLKTIAISLGDPAGIGIEVTLKALNKINNFNPILVGCKKSLEKIYLNLKKEGVDDLANPNQFEILDLPLKGNLTPGEPNLNTGDASFYWLKTAINLVLSKKAEALVTAPIAKYAWHQAGHFYPGQTELLAEITKSKEVSMLFTAVSPNNGWRLNTLLATTHVPLIEIHKQLSSTLIINKLDVLLNFCKKFKEKPKLAIAGLNPHSGEQGLLGKEEIRYLIPAIEQWKQANPLIKLEGPIPPDTCWLSASESWNGRQSKQHFDGYLALYHDQGLIPMKLLAFDSAVNTTLGLPFIRTSPDHGTAFDIANKGCARETSMQQAIQTAWDLLEV